MRKPMLRNTSLGLLFLAACVSLTGCGGCGGLSESAMRARSRKRTPDPEEVAPTPPPPAPAPDAAAEQTPPATAPAPAAATGTPSGVAVVPPAAAPSAAPPPPKPLGPIQTVVQNAKPATPLTPTQCRAASLTNLQKIGQALAQHAQKHGSLPATIVNERGQPLLSWRVALLPELGYGALYDQFKLDEAWNGPRNSQLLEQIPPEFQSPERFDQRTNYLGLAGTGQVFAGARGMPLETIEDGPENTVLVVETEQLAEWTKPLDFVPVANAPRGGIGLARKDSSFALLGDGRVVALAKDLPDHLLAAFLSPDGGEQVVAAELLKEPSAEPVEVAGTPPAATANSAANSVATTTPAQPMPSSTAPPAESAVPPPGTAIALPGDPPAPADPNLIAVPSDEKLAAARTLFRDLYGERYDQARRPEDKAKLADELMKEATEVSQNPPHYYELLRIVRDVAASGGDAPTALKAVELLTARFQVDRLAMRLKVLDDLSRSPKKSEHVDRLRQEAEKLLRESFDADRFEVALPAYERLLEYTRMKGEKTKGDRAEATRLVKLRQPLDAAKLAYGGAVAAAETLKTNSSDPAACETLGKYLCFVKNRWDAGLPYLLRAEEIKLRVVATIDRETGRTPQETLSLADQYWELAQEFKQPYSRGLHLRAALCYHTAENLLPDGLEKLKARKRIEEAGDIYGKEEVQRAIAPPGSPAVVARTSDEE